MIPKYSPEIHPHFVNPSRLPQSADRMQPEEEVQFLDEEIETKSKIVALIKKIALHLDPTAGTRKEIKKIVVRGDVTLVRGMRITAELGTLASRLVDVTRVLGVAVEGLKQGSAFLGVFLVPIEMAFRIRHVVRVRDYSEGISWKGIQTVIQPGMAKESLMRKVFTKNMGALRDRMERASPEELDRLGATLKGRVKLEKKISRINLALSIIGVVGAVLSTIPILNIAGVAVGAVVSGVGFGLSLYHSVKCYKFDREMGLIVRRPGDPFFMVEPGDKIKRVDKIKDFAKWYFGRHNFIDAKKGMLPIEARRIDVQTESRPGVLDQETRLL